MTAAARRWLLCAVLLWTAVVFAPGTTGGFVWDDHLLIGNNTALREWAGLRAALASGFWDLSGDAGTTSRYYRPVVTLAYHAQYQLFGLAPLGYHLVNLALHLACVALVLVWLRRRLGVSGTASDSGWVKGGAAACGALVFAVHPTRSESVSWISGCTDLWMTLFVLLALVVQQARPSDWRARLGSLLLLALALLSKEAAIVVPFALATDALLLSPNAAERRARLRWAAQALVAMALVVALRLWVVEPPALSLHDVLWALPQRVASSFGHYLHATFVPLQPTVLRGQVAMDAQGQLLYSPGSVLAGALGLSALALLLLLSRRRMALRPYAADALWFALGVLPVLNLIPLGLAALVADRFLYLPLLGVCALLARLLASAAPACWPRARPAVVAAGFALALALSSISVSHGQNFRDDFSLWRHELSVNPDRPYVLERMAGFVLARKDYARALAFALRGHELARARRQSGLEVRFAALVLQVLARSTPDLEQARLRRLRDAYDSLLREGRAELVLSALSAGGKLLSPGLSLSLSFDARQRQLLARELNDFRIPHAELVARTLSLRRARAMLESLLRERPRVAEAWALHARLCAQERRFAEAARSLSQARAVAAASPVVTGAQRAIARARQLAAQPVADELERLLSEAQIDLLLGAFEQARRRLDGVEGPHEGVMALRARVDALDRRPDLAQARVTEARLARPEAAARWDALEAEIAHFAGR